MNSIFRFVVVAIAIAFSAQAEPAMLVVPDSAFLSPQTRVRVDGSRRLNLLCTGTGNPTVIMDSGLGGGMIFWRHVILPIARFTRACVYDRAGYGFSDPATRASDAANAVDDLHRLLVAAGIPTPVVYVGHSISGMYGVLFAATYPNELAGAVLIDPSFAHQDTLTTASLTAAQRATAAANSAKAIADMTSCLSLARSGGLTTPKTKAASDCLDTSGNPEKLDDALTREVIRQWSLPSSNAAVLSEFTSATSTGGRIDPDSAELDAAHPRFGDKPLIVLTQSAPKSTARAEEKAFHIAWVAQHEALARLSSRGINKNVSNTGHYIQIDQPGEVIAAVRAVVEESRSGSSQSGR